MTLLDSKAYGDATTISTITFTGFASDIQVGDLLAIGWGSFTTNRTVSSVADNSAQAGTANSYTARSPFNSTASQGGTVYCLVTRKILTTDTVTITLSSTSTRRCGLLLRFDGALGTVDGASPTTNGSASPVSMGPTATLSTTGELSVGFSVYKGSSGSPTFADSTSGYTAVQGLSSGGGSNFIQVGAGYKLTAGTPAETDAHSWTTGVGQLSGEILTFLPAVTAPAITPASSGVSFGASGTLTAPTSVTPATAGVSFGASGTITAPTRVAPATAGVSFGASGSLVATGRVVPATAGVAFGATGTVSLPGAYDAAVIADSPVWYGKGDMASGAMVDSIGGYNLAAFGSPTYGVTGPITSDGAGNLAVLLAKASSQYFQAAGTTTFALGNVFSFEFWINPTTLGTTAARQSVIANTGTSHTPAIEVGGTTGVSGTPGRISETTPGVFIAESPANAVATGSWQHVVYTRTAAGAGNQAIYVNGVAQTLALDASETYVDAAVAWAVGRRTNGSQFFDGAIARVAIYPSALSPTRVTAHYNAATGGSVAISGSAGVAFGASGVVTAPGMISGTAGVTFAGSGSLTAPTFITGATLLPATSLLPADLLLPDATLGAGVAFAASGTITSTGPAPVAPTAAGVSFSATGSITSGTRVTGSSSVTFTGTGAVSAPTSILAAASGVAFSATGAVTASTSITPATSGLVFGASGALAAPTSVAASASALVFGATGSTTAPTIITTAASGASFAGTGTVTAGTVAFISGATGVTFAGSGAITSIPGVSASGSVSFAGSGAIATPAPVTPTQAGVTFTSTGSLTAPNRLTTSAGGVAFNSTGSLSVAVRVITTATGVTFSGTGGIGSSTTVKGYSSSGSTLIGGAGALDARLAGAGASDSTSYGAKAGDA